MKTVLVVEDCADTRKLVSKALSLRVDLRFAETVSQARELLAMEIPDLILLDVSLPDGDGYRLCSSLQDHDHTREIPIIFVTSCGEIDDVVMGFSLGAEDYIRKPFDVRELRARVEASLARGCIRSQQAEVVVKGPLRFHVPMYRVGRVEEGVEHDLGLTAHEFRVLYHLSMNEDRVLTRAQVIDALWNGSVVSERTIDTHVSNIRRKLGPYGDCIRAVRGVGYCFSCGWTDTELS